MRSSSLTSRFRPACLVAIVALAAQSMPALAAKQDKPWVAMDRGPFMTASIEATVPERQMTPKGIAVRLDAARPAHVVFDSDLLRYSVGWTDGTLDWRGVVFDGSHRTWPSVVGNQVFGNGMRPGWAGPGGTFDDPRTRYPSTDYAPQPPAWRDRAYGPLPRDWARYRGLYLHGQHVVFAYTVGNTPVLDSPGFETAGAADCLFTRTINVAKSSGELVVQVIEQPGTAGGVADLISLQPTGPRGSAKGTLVLSGKLAVAAVGATAEMSWELTAEGQVRLHIPAAATPTNAKLIIGRVTGNQTAAAFAAAVGRSAAPQDLSAWTHGGPPRWPQKLVTQGVRSTANDPYVSDLIPAPVDNPWNARMRFGGFDFFKDGRRAALCTWDGDVWLVDGLDDDLGHLTWQRIATGLFQPLGLKIVPDAQGREQIYVGCRDQIVRLHDLDGDGEADFYECFNSDHQVTEHFHEFAMGLDTDAEGNFYYAKGARHALEAVVPQHGTVLKVSRDGQRTEIICGGLRASNGMGLGPRGEVVISDQEGYWMPANRIEIAKPGGFYGNMWAYDGKSRSVSQGNDPPLCWLPVKLDRSPAEELWVRSEKWGPLAGHMIHTSYGVGRLFLVMYEEVDGVTQGGVVPLPNLSFGTGSMRGRFNPVDGQLYVCGLVGWSTNQAEPGGFYRVRCTGTPLHLPTALKVGNDGIALTFAEPLDRTSAQDVQNYAIEQWQYRWSERYGSPHYSVADPERQGQDEVEVARALLDPDGRTVYLRVPGIKPVMQMKIDAHVKAAADGSRVDVTVHNTINRVPERPVIPASLRAVAQAETTGHGDDLQPGVAATFAHGEPRRGIPADTRVQRMVALHVPAGSAPTPLLIPGPFEATFEGELVLRVRDTYTFSALGRGKLQVTVNGQVALDAGAGADLSKARGTPLRLNKGRNKVFVRYQSPDKGDATLRLMWAVEGDATPDPVPPQVWFHYANSRRVANGRQLYEGRWLLAERRCAKCHALPGTKLAMPELAMDAPSLTDVGARLNEPWMAAWISGPRSLRADADMPRCFPADALDRRAPDIAAYLATLGAGAAEKAVIDPASVEAGGRLFASLDCVACHTLPGSPAATRPAATTRPAALPILPPRVPLELVSAKFKPAGLRRYLSDPTKDYHWSPMPNFRLSPAEVDALAAFLFSTTAGAKVPAGKAGDAARGQTLVATAGCLNCHALGDAKSQLAAPALADIAPDRWASGCMAETPAVGAKAPAFGFATSQRAAIAAFAAYAQTNRDWFTHDTADDFARRQFAELRCAACHARDGRESAMTSLLDGEQKALEARYPSTKPAGGESLAEDQRAPQLTWAGEKLQAPWAAQLLAGRLAYKPRDYLRARMPSFPAVAEGFAIGLALEHGVPPLAEPRSPAPDPALAALGSQLAGRAPGQSFECVQCHAIAAQPPRAPFDSPSVNFAYVAERLRKEYYLRWMHNPLRIEPATKMPSFEQEGGKTSLTGVRDGDARVQFEAIWQYLLRGPSIQPPAE